LSANPQQAPHRLGPLSRPLEVILCEPLSGVLQVELDVLHARQVPVLPLGDTALLRWPPRRSEFRFPVVESARGQPIPLGELREGQTAVDLGSKDAARTCSACSGVNVGCARILVSLASSRLSPVADSLLETEPIFLLAMLRLHRGGWPGLALHSRGGSSGAYEHSSRTIRSFEPGGPDLQEMERSDRPSRGRLRGLRLSAAGHGTQLADLRAASASSL